MGCRHDDFLMLHRPRRRWVYNYIRRKVSRHHDIANITKLNKKVLKEKRHQTCRFSSNISPYSIWILWNVQSSKSVMEPSVSIVSFD